jgi:hypothetical protein
MSKRNKLIYVYLGFSAVLLIYLTLPNNDFPSPPPDAIQSDEPADSETPMRRAYFTNYNRQEVLAHYQKQFNKPKNYLYLPTNRLNYPPKKPRPSFEIRPGVLFLKKLFRHSGSPYTLMGLSRRVQKTRYLFRIQTGDKKSLSGMFREEEHTDCLCIRLLWLLFL